MDYFVTKIKPISGSEYSEVYPLAFALYKRLASKTKRRPYVRSAFFDGEKVFLDYFWDHMRTKNWRDRVRRLKFYPCAIDLLLHSRVKPISKNNPNRHSELLHRFGGIALENRRFFVQVKEGRRNREKVFMSIFPEN